jgi:uncharacterized peroxidase-related enzyme
VSQLPQIEEIDATAEVAEIYDDIRRELEIPFVPNIDKTLAIAPNMLRGEWEVLRNVFLKTSLPTSLAAMILFSISAANKCGYCGPMMKVTCMTLGVDAETLESLDNDLESLSPRRVQVIVKFAKKCAMDRANLTAQDFDEVRAQGISDAEIMEVISLAALTNYLNTIADSLKVDVEDAILAALDQSAS